MLTSAAAATIRRTSERALTSTEFQLLNITKLITNISQPRQGLKDLNGAWHAQSVENGCRQKIPGGIPELMHG